MNSHIRRFASCFFGMCLFALLLSPAPTRAQDRAIHWGNYDIDVAVQRDGSLQVTESQRLVVDSGTFRTGSRTFDTGSAGRVRAVSVSEDGQPYERGTDDPGTFVANDDGERFSLSYVFRDPTADQHSMTIAYTIAQSLSEDGDAAVLDWNFFCDGSSCPPIDAGTLSLTLPDGAASDDIEARTSGASVTASRTGDTLRWTLAEPIEGEQVTLQARFPRSVLASNAVLRGQRGSLPPQYDEPNNGNGAPSSTQPSTSPIRFSPTTIVFGIFILIVLFSVMGGSARRRGVMGTPRIPRTQFPPFGGFPGGFGGGRWRGGFGRGRYRRGRYGGGDYGGWGVPPIIPPIIPPTYGDSTPWGGNDRPDQRTDDSGGGSSWDDSGAGGSAWGDSGGGGSSWGDSSGGGSSWGDSGGGGGSWSDSGNSGDSGGGGSNDSSNFN